MSIIKIGSIIILFSSIELFGQSGAFDYDKLRIELLQDKKFILKTDSINKLGQIGLLSSDIAIITATLDKQHPSIFFQKSSAYLGQFQLNEASFLYYVGYLRYKYYNAANPEYKRGNDGALLASLMAGLREPVIRYLRSNVDNYIEILKKSSDWHLNHDYTFFPKEKDPDKYIEQASKIKSMISDLETNRSKRKTEWAIEQEKYLNNLDSTLAQIAKSLTNKKKKSKAQDNKLAEQETAYINADSLTFCGQKIKAPTECRRLCLDW